MRASSDTVTEIAKKVITNVTERSIPLTPLNYHVWYEYFLGSNPALNAEIDSLIASNEHFSEAVNDRLYNEFIGNEKKILQEAHREARKIFQHFFRETLSTRELTSDYSDRMGEYAAKLNELKNLTQIQSFLAEIIADTNKMAESSRQLNQKLGESNSKIELLTKQLEQATRRVLLDSLTGLNNREGFDRKIKHLFHCYRKQEGFFSVIMLDIDFFKRFNDKYGHQIGDEVLRIVSSHLKEILKGKDFPARYGGEEFIVLLPDTPLDKAYMVAEQLRGQISKNRMKIKKTGQSIGNITASLGISEIREEDSPETVVQRADAALYLAKNAGRNNVKTEKDLKLAKTGT